MKAHLLPISFRCITGCLLLLPLALACALAPAGRAASTPSFTTLRTLNSAVEGVVTLAPLTQGADGYFYGVAREGGSNNVGSVFRINGDGTNFSILSSFPGASNGANPEGGLVQAHDGQFYGTTFAGGPDGYGTLFQVTPTGILTVLQAFTNGDPGGNPSGALLAALDGSLYGTASFGGAAGYGTVFRTGVPAGVTNVLTAFAAGTDGAYPESDLFQAADGGFYGTTTRGGASDLGTFFRVTSSGARQILYSFTGVNDGAEPLRGVVQAADGKFYGIARTGGVNGGGVLYRIDVNGALTALYSFSPTDTNPYNSYGNLALGSDGNLYGVTFQGGLAGAGTIFRLTLSGNFTVLYNFSGGGDGGYPRAGLTLGSDGALYGTTSGLNGQFSTVFRFDFGLPAPAPSVLLFQPAQVKAGDTLALQGNHFIGTDKVTFLGADGSAIAAKSFTVRSRTYLEAVVPDGAVSGAVTVQANGKTAVTSSAVSISSTPPPAVLPTVTLTVKDGIASEAGNNKGKFKFNRTGDTTGELVVLFKARNKSTATRGVDYNFATGGVVLPSVVNSITIPAGASSVGLSVQPIDDTEPEADETVMVAIKPGANYVIGDPAKGTVAIADDD